MLNTIYLIFFKLINFNLLIINNVERKLNLIYKNIYKKFNKANKLLITLTNCLFIKSNNNKLTNIK